MEPPGDLQLHIERLEAAVQNHRTRPQTIAVIGKHGCGKSSFLNTAMAAISGNYHEHALVGNFREEGKHVTRRLKR